MTDACVKNIKNGIILKALSGFYYVKADGELYECRASGLFRKNKITPLVGDNVEIEVLDNSKGYLTKIHERKNSLVRPPVANIDNLFIVSCAGNPKPNTLVIDKLIAISLKNNIEPIIVFNKSDIEPLDDLAGIYEKAGFKSFVVSCKDGVGGDEILSAAKGKTSAFCGNTGVGKSSILNLIDSGLSLKTGEVSEKLGRGRHTTRHTEIYEISDDTYIADSPGFSALETEKTSVLLKDELKNLFPEFSDYATECKFLDCCHISEKGCKVREAVENGEIAVSRYESYKMMFEESKQIKEWQLK